MSESDVNDNGYIIGPIDICITHSTRIITSPLRWCNYDSAPKKLKLTNTGKTILVSGKWNTERPYVCGSFLTDQYIFYQLHFHSQNDFRHTVDGVRYPIEMHVVHFKRDYLTPEIAEKYTDGILIMTYFFKLRSWDNEKITEIIDNLRYVKSANTSTSINNATLSRLIHTFTDDYFMYRGSVSSSTSKLVMWIFCRRPMFISETQLYELLQLNGTNGYQIKKKSKTLNPNACKKYMYFVNPSSLLISTLYYVFD